MGSAPNAGLISGSPRYNYSVARFELPQKFVEKRRRLRALADQFGVYLRAATLHFAAAPDAAAALIAGVHTEEEALANASSMKDKISHGRSGKSYGVSGREMKEIA